MRKWEAAKNEDNKKAKLASQESEHRRWMGLTITVSWLRWKDVTIRTEATFQVTQSVIHTAQADPSDSLCSIHKAAKDSGICFMLLAVRTKLHPFSRVYTRQCIKLHSDQTYFTKTFLIIPAIDSQQLTGLQRAERFKSSIETFATCHTYAKKRIGILCGGKWGNYCSH